MKAEQDNTRTSGPDKSLDIPSEANREKHENFGEESGIGSGAPGKEVGGRRSEWEEGLRAGKEENEKRDSTPERHGNSSIPEDDNETLGTP